MAGSGANLFEQEAIMKKSIGSVTGILGAGLISTMLVGPVPVDGQEWATDPFAVTQKDGLLYGRGTCDMKGFIAVLLAMAPEFAAAKLKVPLHFAFSYDEEVGCIGVRRLLAELGKRKVKPMACVVGASAWSGPAPIKRRP